MRRRRSRGTPYLGTDKGLRELYPRLGLDEQARSQSTALHNRRKPGLLSTGTPELAAGAVTTPKVEEEAVTTGKLASNLNGINAKIPNQEFTKDKVSTGGKWAKDDQHSDTLYKNAEGKLPATDLPASAVTGSYNGNPGKLGYGDIGGTPDLSAFVKDAAIKGFQNKKQVQKIVKDMVKKSALGK